jgi:hypothetical protein
LSSINVRVKFGLKTSLPTRLIKYKAVAAFLIIVSITAHTTLSNSMKNASANASSLHHKVARRHVDEVRSQRLILEINDNRTTRIHGTQKSVREIATFSSMGLIIRT